MQIHTRWLHAFCIKRFDDNFFTFNFLPNISVRQYRSRISTRSPPNFQLHLWRIRPKTNSAPQTVSNRFKSLYLLPTSSSFKSSSIFGCSDFTATSTFYFGFVQEAKSHLFRINFFCDPRSLKNSKIIT